MSIRASMVIWCHYPIGGGEFLLALALADWADENGCSIYPTVGSAAKRVRLSPRQVQRYLRAIKERKFLELVGTTEYGAHIYKLRLDLISACPVIFGRKRSANLHKIENKPRPASDMEDETETHNVSSVVTDKAHKSHHASPNTSTPSTETTTTTDDIDDSESRSGLILPKCLSEYKSSVYRLLAKAQPPHREAIILQVQTQVDRGNSGERDAIDYPVIYLQRLCERSERNEYFMNSQAKKQADPAAEKSRRLTIQINELHGAYNNLLQLIDCDPNGSVAGELTQQAEQKLAQIQELESLRDEVVKNSKSLRET